MLLKYNLLYVYDCLCKTSHVCSKTEIRFIAQDYSYTQEVSIHCVSLANLSGSAFLESNFRPCNVVAKRMAPLKNTNWWTCHGTAGIGS